LRHPLPVADATSLGVLDLGFLSGSDRWKTSHLVQVGDGATGIRARGKG